MGSKINNFSKQIDGITVTELAQITDSRGSVLHMLRSDSAEYRGFGECYFSEILPGVVKAWKYHHSQAQNIAVPVGRIILVIYDNQAESPTYGNILKLELGRPDSYFRVYIPPKLWYGFSCISNNPALLVNCADQPHDPNDSKILNKYDDSIPFSWSS